MYYIISNKQSKGTAQRTVPQWLKLLGEVIFGQLDNHTAQTQQGNEVGDRHEAIEGIGNVPNQAQFHGSANESHQNKHGLVHGQQLSSQQELEAARAVECPAKNGGQCKQNNCDGNHGRTKLRTKDQGNGSNDRQGSSPEHH